jgi:lipoate-protein ligase A
VTDTVEDLYDYEALRREREATMFVVRVERPTVVLGSKQQPDVLDEKRVSDTPVRRRKGGGGLVLLRPHDLWIDWWIPRDDARWAHDVHVSSFNAGEWWADALRPLTKKPVVVHRGALEGEPTFRVVCFAGRGPGEVFVAGRKAVGLTQWRVREGVFLSTVLHAHPTSDILEYLAHVPEGLGDALDHSTLSSLALVDPDAIVERLDEVSGPWRHTPRPLSS